MKVPSHGVGPPGPGRTQSAQPASEEPDSESAALAPAPQGLVTVLAAEPGPWPLRVGLYYSHPPSAATLAAVTVSFFKLAACQ